MELVVEDIQEEGEDGGEPGCHQDHHHRPPAQLVPHTVEVQDLHIVLLEVLVGNGQIRQTGEKYGNREILK